MDRRHLLLGAASLAVAACSRAETPAKAAAPAATDTLPAPGAIDLSELETRHDGRLGFAARDLSTGKALSWHGDQRFVYCSTFKLYLAAATLIRVQKGEETLERALAVTRADILNNSPVGETAVGKSLTVREMCKAIVEVSDNACANILMRELGGIEAMRAFYRSIGDERTTVDRWEPEMNRLDGDKDTTSPHQAIANLYRLFVDPATPLSADSASLLTGWMLSSPTGPDRIKAGAPGWTVAHKTGTGGYGPTNDIGIISKGDRKVIVAAFFHGTEGSTDAARAAAIADATRMALLSFDAADAVRSA